jgi:NADH-quinone oxidoreductase subunit A
MYPWAVTVRTQGVFSFLEMMVFITVLLVGLVYILKKGALRWH